MIKSDDSKCPPHNWINMSTLTQHIRKCSKCRVSEVSNAPFAEEEGPFADEDRQELPAFIQSPLAVKIIGVALHIALGVLVLFAIIVVVKELSGE